MRRWQGRYRRAQNDLKQLARMPQDHRLTTLSAEEYGERILLTPCPRCLARVGEYCTRGALRIGPHSERVRVAREGS